MPSPPPNPGFATAELTTITSNERDTYAPITAEISTEGVTFHHTFPVCSFTQIVVRLNHE